MKKSLKYRISRTAPVLIVVGLLVAVSCDLFEEDALPAAESLQVNQHDFFILPNSSAVIDFKSLVTTAEEVSISVTRLPRRGTLSKVSDAIFRFDPGQDFVSGKDRFVISFSRNGKTLKTDSVFITVSQDTTEFPCGLYAVADYAHTGPGESVQIPYLANDRFCDINKNDIDRTIYYAPAHGQAVLAGDSIIYTPVQGFEGTDQFVYRLFVEADSLESYGLVSIQVGEDTCAMVLNNDSFSLAMTSSQQAVFGLNVLQNDRVCYTDSTVLIVQPPVRGTASAVSGGFINYTTEGPFTEAYTDSLVYRLCNGDSCYDATVTLHVFSIACEFTVRNDSIDLRDSVATGMVYIPVLDNDELCGETGTLSIHQSASYGTVYPYTDAVGYLPDPLMVKNDSLTYKLCIGQVCKYGTVYIFRE